MIWVKLSKQIGCEPESKQEKTHLVLAADPQLHL